MAITNKEGKKHAMTIQTITKKLMKKTRMTQVRAARIGGLSQSTISSALERNSRIEVYAAILDAMGYELVVRPIKRGALAEDHYVVGLVDEPELTEEPKLSWYAPAEKK